MSFLSLRTWNFERFPNSVTVKLLIRRRLRFKCKYSDVCFLLWLWLLSTFLTLEIDIHFNTLGILLSIFMSLEEKEASRLFVIPYWTKILTCILERWIEIVRRQKEKKFILKWGEGRNHKIGFYQQFEELSSWMCKGKCMEKCWSSRKGLSNSRKCTTRLWDNEVQVNSKR